MYLSHLLIDTGNNPDRPRPGRLWLRNRYRVHQRLCMAFPSTRQRERDPEFLLPFEPDGFQEQCPIHVSRDSEHNFLFRIDPHAGGSVSILVLSALEPDWGYAFHNAQYLLAAKPLKPRALEFIFERGECYRFRLEANPTKRLCKDSRHSNGDPVSAKWVGKRVPVSSDELGKWLTCRAENCGFIVREITNLQSGYAYFNRSSEREKGQRLRAVRYEGILEVSDPERLREMLISGIGSGKTFGFGLLSVAPVRGGL